MDSKSMEAVTLTKKHTVPSATSAKGGLSVDVMANKSSPATPASGSEAQIVFSISPFDISASAA